MKDIEIPRSVVEITGGLITDNYGSAEISMIGGQG
jgi:hypothetical protein